MSESAWSGLFTVSFGLLFALIGYFFLKRAIGLSRRGVPARATVVGHDRGGEESVSFVEFQDGSGKKWRVRLWEGGCPPIGTPISVVYDRDTPERATAAPLSGVWKPAIIFLGLGLLAVALGVGMCTGLVTVNQ